MMQDVVADAPVELRLDYELSREEYRAAQHDVTQHLLGSIPSSGIAYVLAAATVLCGIIIGMGYAELVNGYLGRGWRWKWFIALALLGLGLITIWQQRLRAARIYAAITPDDSISLGPQTLTLTHEGLAFTGRAMATQVAWPALKSIAQENSNLLIILNNYSFFGVPDRAFADAAQRALWLAALREHAPHATLEAAPISAAKRAVVMPIDPQPAPPPLAAPMAVGLRENLRAGGRLAFFQRVTAGDFVATAEAFIALVAMELLLQLVFDIAGAGVHGQFNYDDLPQALLFVPLTLMFGVAAARRAGDRSLLLALPVALVAAGLVISLVGGVLGLMLQHKIIALAARHWRWLFYGELLWWCAIIVFACWRFVPARPLQSQHRAGLAVLGVALLAAPLLWNSAYHLWIAADEPESTEAQRAIEEKYFALANEKGFYAQQDLLAHALTALQPERPGVVDVYTLTAGLYASEDVFMKEVMLIDTLLRKRFDAEGRALMLINNAKTVHDTPLASATSLSAALKHIGELMNVDEDVLVLYVSSHGSQKHELAVDFWPLRLQTIDPPALKAALDESKIKWRVLVVSACYSGGFVEPLKDEHTLIITASSATKTSFGCGHESDATYLATALFDEALRKTYSFETAFEAARKAIRTREQAQGFEASDPQMFVGAAIREKLLQVEKRLSAPTQ
jgi:hypothetical protein